MKDWLIRLLGGYPTIYDAIYDIDDKEDKHEILTEAVKHLFNTISVEDILREDITTKQWYFKDKGLSDAKKKSLIAEATSFLNSGLWKMLKADVLYQANKKIFILSRNDLDLIMGKSWTLVFDCITTRLKSMSRGSGKYNTAK